MSDKGFKPQDLPASAGHHTDAAAPAAGGRSFAPQSPLGTGIRCRCPRCGQGKLYQELLEVRAECPSCQLDFSQVDSGDGPAVFVILILGAITVLGAFIVDAMFAPPYWVHALIWGPVIIGGSIGLLAPFKATLIALQYQNKAREGRLVDHKDDK